MMWTIIVSTALGIFGGVCLLLVGKAMVSLPKKLLRSWVNLEWVDSRLDRLEIRLDKLEERQD